MHELIGKKVLITTQDWFYGKDGRQYKAIHGTLKGVHESSKTLGFIPNRAHANWYIEIGEMTVMGCQVMYISECETAHTGDVDDWRTSDTEKGGIVKYNRPSIIYTVS